jgi:hypothetical protein
MKRTLPFLAALAAVLSLPATASAFRGVAVAKDAARHSVVVASKGGLVRTVRAPGRAGSVRLGHRLVFSARRLSDGTFRASSLRARGNARHAVIRGVVVRNQRRLHRLLISAGGSVFAIKARTSRGFSSNRGPRAGDRVEVRVTISEKGLRAGSLEEIGHTDGLELEGIFLGIADGKLRLAVAHRGEVFVMIPDGFQLPTLNPGDEIELVVSVDTAGAFTLVSVQNDDENDDDDEGIDEDHGKIEVKGAITALAADSITVQAGQSSPVTCAVPAGTHLSGFAVKDQVEMKCALVDGKLTLTRLKSEDDEDDDDENDDGDHEGDE